MAFKAFPAFALMPLMHSVQFSKTNFYYLWHYVTAKEYFFITFLVLVYMTFDGFLEVAVRMFYRSFCIPKDFLC